MIAFTPLTVAMTEYLIEKGSNIKLKNSEGIDTF